MNIWEEKNSIEPRKNCSDNIKSDSEDIIIKIEKKSINSEYKSIGKTKTTEQFIADASVRHGDRYDYSNSLYKKSNIKIEIICSKHGSFWQEPSKHIGGQGCMGCRQTSTVEDFIKKGNIVHGQLYDYSRVIYSKSKTKIDIVCKLHGSFWQTPRAHISGKGCYMCANNRKKTLPDFVKSAKEVHGEKYDYSDVIYKNNNTLIKIICKKHGNFYQTPKKHLQKNGCEKCGHHISLLETEFLDYLSIKNRGTRVDGWKNKPVDGYDKQTNTMYEFLGDYWHGNPLVYDKNKKHPVVKMTYGELYKKTFDNLNKLVSLGYTVKYIWERDWKNYKAGIDKIPNIITHIQSDLLTG